jgi:lipopolysaccharide export system protein LptA
MQWLLWVWLMSLALSGFAAEQTVQPQPGQSGTHLRQTKCSGPRQTLDITADHMTFDSQANTFLFEDSVRVLRCDVTILCDRLRVFNDPKGEQVERIVATGDVRMQQGVRHARADRAEYFDADQKLVLTGNPRAWDVAEQNELTGEEIVVFLEEDKMLVKRARVLFHPRQQASRMP